MRSMKREEIDGIEQIQASCALYCRGVEKASTEPFGDRLCARCAEKTAHIVSGKAYEEAVERGDIIFVPAVTKEVVPPVVHMGRLDWGGPPKVFGKPPKF